MIVIMAGLPATGKSTLCRELASRLSGTVLDKDEIRATLFKSRDIEYSTQQDDFCMSIMLQAAAYILQRDPRRIIFLDGRPFSRTYQLDQVVKFADDKNQAWRILECVCSDQTAKARLDEQGKSGTHPAADRDYAMYLRVKARFEEITLPKCVIDTEQALELCLQSALGSLA